MDGAANDLELNEPQLDAVAHVEGPLLVFAGAGSGKTRVITYRIANLVATHRVPPYRILAVTFTNKAAGEMRERLDRLVGTDLARDLWVGTFHATCARLLRRHHEAVGLGRDFAIYDESDQKSVVTRIVREKKLDDKRYPPRQLLGWIHEHKQEAVTPDAVERNGFFDDVAVDVYAAYEKALRQSNACDFDDLLLHVLRLVELPAPGESFFPGDDPAPDDLRHRAGDALRQQFRYVLVDEFQDTNAVQYRLVRALVRDQESGGNLAVVGDDDQSIYSWRGADVRNIRGFSRDFPNAHVVRLEQNYRSSKRIVRAALGVISPSKLRVAKELWTANEDGASIDVRAAVDERDEAGQVVSMIEARLREGWTRSEIAVLYRTHAQSRVLEDALRQARLPYRIVGGLRFFERAEVKDLLGYLRLTANPKSDVDFLRIVNTPARGIGSTTVERVQAVARFHDLSLLEAVRCIVNGTVESDVRNDAKKRLSAFLTVVDDLAEDAVKSVPPSDIAAHAIERSGYRAALEDEDSIESQTRLQNLAELVGSIRDYEEQARAEGSAPSIGGFLERTALVTAGDEKNAQGSDVVTLMTVHAAKGLEFRGVVITGLEDELFPFKGYRALGSEADALGAAGDEPVTDGLLSPEEEDLEEERRLAYVAITRARESLTLCYAAQRTIFGQTRYTRPSRFLRDLPADDVKMHAPTRRAFVPRGWTNAPPSSNAPRAPFVHPRAMTERVLGRRETSPPSTQREAGERYVEMDQEMAHASLRRGKLVRHKKFGEGKVLEVVDGGIEPKVVASFPGWGTMTVLQRFLEVVD